MAISIENDIADGENVEESRHAHCIPRRDHDDLAIEAGWDIVAIVDTVTTTMLLLEFKQCASESAR